MNCLHTSFCKCTNCIIKCGDTHIYIHIIVVFLFLLESIWKVLKMIFSALGTAKDFAFSDRHVYVYTYVCVSIYFVFRIFFFFFFFCSEFNWVGLRTFYFCFHHSIYWVYNSLHLKFARVWVWWCRWVMTHDNLFVFIFSQFSELLLLFFLCIHIYFFCFYSCI